MPGRPEKAFILLAFVLQIKEDKEVSKEALKALIAKGASKLYHLKILFYLYTLPDRLYHTPDSQKNVLYFLTTFQIE